MQAIATGGPDLRESRGGIKPLRRRRRKKTRCASPARPQRSHWSAKHRLPLSQLCTGWDHVDHRTMAPNVKTGAHRLQQSQSATGVGTAHPPVPVGSTCATIAKRRIIWQRSAPRKRRAKQNRIANALNTRRLPPTQLTRTRCTPCFTFDRGHTNHTRSLSR